MDAMRTVVFHGPLAEKFGSTFEFSASSVAEVCRALTVMVPGFEKYMMESKDNDMEFAILADDENYEESQLANPLGTVKEVHFVPVIGGAKKEGILQTIVGAVLIVVGAVIGYFFGWTGIGAVVGKAMIGAGISMVVGGVVQMLSPQPKTSQAEKKDDPTSYLFNGAVNVSAQGASVPVLYGESFVGSVVVSAGISATDGYVIPSWSSPGYSDGSYRGGGSMMGNVIARAIDEAE